MKKFTKEEIVNSRRQSVKCTTAEAQEFQKIVEEWLTKKGLKFRSSRALTSYYGNVRIYNGKTIKSISLKRSKKLLAFKNPDGTIEGTPEGIEQLKKHGGDYLYELDYHPREVKDHYTFFRTEWESDINDKLLISNLRKFLQGK